MSEKAKKKRSLTSWLVEFAEEKKSYYILSIIFAIAKVVCSMVPYIYMADIVKKVLELHQSGEVPKMDDFTKDIIMMAVFWVLSKISHAISTTISHATSFVVLANIRRRLAEKLSRLPLGSVMADSSGTYKNIICERVDSIETTLAHIIPEVGAGILVPIVLIIYMLTINVKLTLLSMLCVPVGAVFFIFVMAASKNIYGDAITKTKALNDSAVEYINGIEVIKAFSKSGSSYEKFANAAKECASCYIEWMRKCNLWQNLALILMPFFLLGLLPFGAIEYMHGNVSGGDLLMLVILSLSLIAPINTVTSYSDDISKMGLIIGEVTEILEREELVRPESMTEKLSGSDIILENVHFGYEEKEILHGIRSEERPIHKIIV